MFCIIPHIFTKTEKFRKIKFSKQMIILFSILNKGGVYYADKDNGRFC